MELESIMLSKINLSEKDKYHDFTLMWSLRNKQGKRESKKHSYLHTEQTDSYQRGRGGEGDG